MKLITLIFFLSLLNVQNTFSQLYNNGAIIYVQPNANIYAATDICNANTGTIRNEGTITTIQNFKNNTNSDLKGNGSYNVQGNWTNTASYQANNSTVEFFGTSTSQIAAGEDDFYNVTINKSPNATTSLIEDADISNELNFAATNNQLFLGNNDLSFHSSATITGFNETNYIVTNADGCVKKESMATFTFPIGANNTTYNPVILEENGTTDDISVRCLLDALNGGTSGSPETNGFIASSWLVEETIVGGSSLNMTVQWNALDELTDFNRTESAIVRFGPLDWEDSSPIATPATGNNPYQSNRTPIEELGVFSVSSNTVLPIQLTYFQVKKQNEKDALLFWQTQSEVNIDFFSLQKSTDNKNWTDIGKVSAKENSSFTTKYEFTEQDFRANQIATQVFYYRLKIVENDAYFTYSETKSIHVSKQDKWMTIYPNPTESGIYIQKSATLEDKALFLKLYDGTGKVILIRDFKAELNGSFWAFPDLPTGVYHVELSSTDNVIQVEQLVVK